MNGLVSIIIPTYNRGHLIQHTIESVQNQTYIHWELIIIDDGSTDNTKHVVKQLRDSRIHYYSIDHCGIIGKVRNTGMQFTKGDYIAFLDSDDLWVPNKLSFQLALFAQYKQVAFTFSHGEQFGNGAIPPPLLETFLIGNIFYAHLLEGRFVIYPSTFIFKKEVLNTIEWFDENFSAGESDFFLRIARKFDGIFSGEKLVKLRKHAQNISRERAFIFSLDNIRMIKKFLNKDYLTKKEYIILASKQHYKLGLLYLKHGNPSESFKSFIEYSRLKPFNYKGWIRLTQAWLSGMRTNQLLI